MADGLPTYDEALEILRGRIKPLGRRFVLPLAEAGGYSVAGPVVAVEPNPRFDNTAVDGYAIGRGEDAVLGQTLRLAGVSAAGDARGPSIAPGSAVRVLTGAPIPAGTFGVIMQEDVRVLEGLVKLETSISEGANIRRRGDDFGQGAKLVDAGHVINAGTVALLASQGLTQVEVFERPRVAVVTTGDELLEASKAPGPFQLRDSNGPMLSRQAFDAGASSVKHALIGDSLETLIATLDALSREEDLIIVGGGASVGDKDFLGAAVKRLGEVHFHGVRIRPGKPALLGQVGETPLLGLPGNPASAFVCFEIFVREAIHRLAGWDNPVPQWLSMPFKGDHEPLNRDNFVRCKLVEGVAVPVGNQGSFGLRSLADGDCLVRIPAGESCDGISMQMALLLRV